MYKCNVGHCRPIQIPTSPASTTFDISTSELLTSPDAPSTFLPFPIPHSPLPTTHFMLTAWPSIPVPPVQFWFRRSAWAVPVVQKWFPTGRDQPPSCRDRQEEYFLKEKDCDAECRGDAIRKVLGGPVLAWFWSSKEVVEKSSRREVDRRRKIGKEYGTFSWGLSWYRSGSCLVHFCGGGGLGALPAGVGWSVYFGAGAPDSGIYRFGPFGPGDWR